jgi:hypothetical protein
VTVRGRPLGGGGRGGRGSAPVVVVVVDFVGANPETDGTGDEALGVQVE